MNLYKILVTIFSITMISRITGLIREILFARTFGASIYTDAFNVAFRIPNVLRRLFAEGSFSQAFVPILTEYKNQKGNMITKNLVNHIATILIWAMLAITIIGILITPIIIYFFAAGLQYYADALTTSIVMTRIMFPYIGFITFVAFAGTILNTWNNFIIPAFTSVLLNISFIITSLFVIPYFNISIYAMAFAVLFGGIFQVLLQIPILIKIGMLPQLYWNPISSLQHEGVKRILKKMGQAIFAVSASQISLIMNTNIASHLAQGSISWLSYADRLMEFPTSLLGVSLGTILLPSLSKAYSKQDKFQYSALLDWSLRLTFFFTLPCAVFLITLSQPLTATLFHYGKFDATAVNMTGRALTAYGIGLIGLISVKILSPGFYAKQDIHTPIKITIITLIATQLMNFIFIPWIAHAGLALSIGLGACLNAILLFWKLRNYNIYIPQSGWYLFIIKIVCALFLVTGVALIINQNFDWIALQNQPIQRILALLLVLFTCSITYFIALFAMKFRFDDLIYKTHDKKY